MKSLLGSESSFVLRPSNGYNQKRALGGADDSLLPDAKSVG